MKRNGGESGEKAEAEARLMGWDRTRSLESFSPRYVMWSGGAYSGHHRMLRNITSSFDTS